MSSVTSYWGFPLPTLTFEVFEVTFLKLIINLFKVFFLQAGRAVNVKGKKIRTEDKCCPTKAKCFQGTKTLPEMDC